jgi:cytochrome c-type biogenesis protein CcmI
VPLLLAAALSAAGPALAQHDDPGGSLADVPAGPGRIAGEIVHDQRPGAAAGVDVALYSLGPDGAPGTRRTTTDAEGRFAFEGISNDPGVVYLVGARFAELPFPGDRVVFAEGQTERRVVVHVSDPVEDTSTVRVVQSSLRITLGAGRLVVAEIHRLRNDGARVVHVTPERRAGRRAPLEIELLPGAEGFSMPLGVVPEGLVRDGRDVTFWGPLYPGEQEISFRYEVPAETGTSTLAKRFPSAAEQIRIFGFEDGVVRDVVGFERGDVVEEQGLRFRPWETRSTPAGFVARLEVDVPEMRADPGAVRLAESQVILEVDDVTLQARENHRIEVEGATPVRAAPGELLLEIPLPAAAEDVRFSADSNELGLVRTETGVGIVGPLRPGSHGIGLAYRLRSSPEGVQFERHFDRRLPLLRVFVADTGVAVTTDRLHRRRPVRDADRTYLVFEAFELQGDERMHFSLRPLPRRGGSTGPAVAAGVLLAVVCMVFLLAPLGRSGEEAGADVLEEEPEARSEREHVYEAIHDLDHDHETGKLDDASYQALRAELRARAVALLAEERAAEAAPKPAPAPVAPATCAACGATGRPGDRFCAGCGAKLPEA